MHVKVAIPTIDDKNPLYCPAIPAALYLKSLRGRSHISERSRCRPDLFQSFARTLEKSTDTVDSDDEHDIEFDWIIGKYCAPDDLPVYSSVAGELCHHFIQEDTASHLAPYGRLETSSLKRKLSFSDLGAPPKYARSQPSFHDSSFDIEIQHEKLDYFPNDIESSPQRAPRYSGVEIPDARTLADRLDSALPGIRLRLA